MHASRPRFLRVLIGLIALVSALCLAWPARGLEPKRALATAATPIINWEYDQLDPAAAFNPQANEYVVVWEDHRPSAHWDIYGRRVRTDGAPLGDPFGIAWDGDKRRLAPDAVYNPTRGEFLVVWEYEWTTQDHDIYARRVRADAALVGPELGVTTLGQFESNPAVAYNPDQDQYLVVWEHLTDVGRHEIYARRLAGNGELLGGPIAVDVGTMIGAAAPAPAATAPGEPDSALVPYDALAPAAAYDPALDHYLVVWQDKNLPKTDYDITGRFVDAGGIAAEDEIAVSTWEYDQVKPRLVWNPAANEFLVVWEDHHWGWGEDWDIYGQRVRSSGALAGGNFGISWDGPNHRENPAVAYRPVAGEYVVAWEYAYLPEDHDIYWRRVRDDGSLAEAEAPLSNLVSAERRPAIAADNGSGALVAWEDARDYALQAYNIYADVLSLAAATPTATQTRSPTPRTPTPTRTATRVTPTNSPAPSRTATLPPDCTDLLVNGDFQTGELEPWGAAGSTSLGEGHNSRFGAALVASGPASAELWQDCVLPPGSNPARLEFWWRADSATAQAEDRLILYAQDATGATELRVLRTADPSAGWQQEVLDLTSWAGRLQMIHFTAHGDGGEPTTFRLDDLHLWACALGMDTPTATATPSATGTRTPSPTATCTATATPSATRTPTGTRTSTATGTRTPTRTSTPTKTASATITATPGTTPIITFEESILNPQGVLNQYCSNSITNKGVEFPSIPRIFSPVFIYALAPTPSTGMSSPPYALFSQLSATEDKTIVIHFTAPQSHVGMKVGLDRKYSATVFAHLAVYSSDTPSTSTELDADTVTLGKGPTDITQPLEVTRTSADIRSAVVDFYTLAYGVHAVEIIDDLTFSTVGPTCITDWNPPSVQITQPAADGAVLQTVKNWVAFTATDTESGIAKVTVSFLDAAGAELEGFNACTGSMPCTGPNAKTQQGDFYTSIPEGCKTIRVQAWDYVGRTGQAQRQVSVLLPGPNMNLWARALEITQGTQPWLPTNSTTRLSGSTPPSYTYPAVPTSVPLVAGRKTVVRLFAGVEGTKSGAQVVNVRAKLKCFTNATYAVPFPGVSEISPQTQPPDLLDEITVSPTVSLDTQRRDTRLSWNFVLPDAWTQAGTIYLEARVEAPYGVPECVGCDDAANRIRVAAVPFNSVPSFSANLVTLVRVIRTLGTNVYTPTVQQVNAAVNYLAARYPVDETTVHTAANLDLKFTDYFNPPIEGGSRCKYLMAMLKLGVWNIGKKAVFALVDLQGGQTNGFPCGGLGGSGYAFGSDGDGFCEEVGHAVGLNHSGPPPGHGVCNAECDHGWCDTDWPYPHGNVGAFGFNIMTMQVVPDKYVQCLTPGVCDNGINEDNDMIGTSGCPALDIECPGAPDPNPPADWTNAPHDIMSYGPCFKYISPRNWIRLFNAFTGSNLAYPKNPSAPNPGAGAETAPVTLAAASDRLEIGAPARYLMVRGAENPEGAWVLLPAYEMEYPAGTSDAAGQGDHEIALLGSESQELFVRRLTALAGHVDQGDPPTAVLEPPSFAELVPLSDGVARLELCRGGETLAEVARSAHVPSVTITWPTAFGFQGQPGGPRAVWSGSDADGDDLHYLVQYTRGAQGQNPAEWQNLAGDLTTQELALDLTAIPGGMACMLRVLATDGLNTGVATSPSFALAGKPPVVSISSPVSGTTVLEGGSLPLRGAAQDVEDGALSGELLTWRSDRDGPLGSGGKLEVSGLSPGVHRITLEARDSHNMTGTATVSITVADRPNSQPIADAGPDRWTAAGRAVTLDGSRSADADGDALAFEWSVVSAPAGGTGRLSDPGAMQPGFLADRPGDYRIELTVYDGKVSSLADAVTVHVSGEAGWRTYLPAIVRAR